MQARPGARGTLGVLVIAGFLLAAGGCTQPTAPSREVDLSSRVLVDPSLVYSSAPHQPRQTQSSTVGKEEELEIGDAIDSGVPGSGVGDLVLTPNEVYGPTPQQSLVLDQAHYAVAKDCMEKRGFTFLAPPPKLEGATVGITPWEGSLGLIDRDYAEIHGFQRDSDDVITAIHGSADFGQTGTEDWTVEYEAALRGEGGCDSTATESVEEGSRDVVNETKTLAEIGFIAFDRTEVAPEFVAAISDWSACMAESGYDYSDPIEPASQYGSGFVGRNLEFDGRAPAKGEVDTALTDLDCKDKVGLIEHYRKVLWEHRSTLIEEYRPNLEALNDHWAERVKHANEVIAKFS